jgi:hypothetical protein
MSKATPFKISVSDDLLNFINQRVKTARIPPEHDLSESEKWSNGVPVSTITQLQKYWIERYDWRSVEAKLNEHLKMFTMPIEESGEVLTMHFVHHRSEHKDALPLLFQHGWPGSFLEVYFDFHFQNSSSLRTWVNPHDRWSLSSTSSHLPWSPDSKHTT